MRILSGCLILALFSALVLLYIRYIEKHTLFHPSKEIEFSPGEVGLDFEEVFFKTKDNLKLNGWFIPARGVGYTVLFCHGNAGNISHRLQKIKFFNQLGCSVFIFDYRGYGKSKGRPSEEGMYLDVKSAYDYLLSRGIGNSQIIGYGESLGGAIIIDLAAKNKVAGLIAESSFSSGRDMARRVYPFIPYWLFSSHFDSASKIKSITAQKLIIHSLNDEIVPYDLSLRLYAAAAGPKEFLQISGPHNSCFYDSEKILEQRLPDFLSRLSK